MENLGYYGPFRDPSVLRMFDARVAVMRLLSEQIYQLDIHMMNSMCFLESF